MGKRIIKQLSAVLLAFLMLYGSGIITPRKIASETVVTSTERVVWGGGSSLTSGGVKDHIYLQKNDSGKYELVLKDVNLSYEGGQSFDDAAMILNGYSPFSVVTIGEVTITADSTCIYSTYRLTLTAKDDLVLTSKNGDAILSLGYLPGITIKAFGDIRINSKKNGIENHGGNAEPTQIDVLGDLVIKTDGEGIWSNKTNLNVTARNINISGFDSPNAGIGIYCGSAVSIDVVNDINISSSEIALEFDANSTIKAGGNLNLNSTEHSAVFAMGKIDINVGGNINMTALKDHDTIITMGGSINIKSGKSVFVSGPENGAYNYAFYSSGSTYIESGDKLTVLGTIFSGGVIDIYAKDNIVVKGDGKNCRFGVEAKSTAEIESGNNIDINFTDSATSDITAVHGSGPVYLKAANNISVTSNGKTVSSNSGINISLGGRGLFIGDGIAKTTSTSINIADDKAIFTDNDISGANRVITDLATFNANAHKYKYILIANGWKVTFDRGERGSFSPQPNPLTRVVHRDGDLGPSYLIASQIPTISVDGYYKLIGWKYSLDNVIYEDPTKVYITDNATFTAQYIREYWKVLFDAGEHGVILPKNVYTTVGVPREYPGSVLGSSYLTASQIFKITVDEGYDFIGWKYSLDGVVYKDPTIIHITDDATLTAQYAKQSWIVTFDEGEYGSMAPKTSPLSVGVLKGDVLTTAQIPTITTNNDYKFIGWKSSLDNIVYEDLTGVAIIGNVTFTAQYIDRSLDPNECWIVTFEKGDYGDIAPKVSPLAVNVVKGNILTTAQIPSVTANNGYKFIGWKSSFDDMVYEDLTKVTIIDNVTFTAQYIDKSLDPDECWIVTFEKGDYGDIASNASPLAVNVPKGSSLLAEQIPAVTANEGYRFIGWKSSINGTIYADPSEIAVTQDVTYTAQYEKDTDKEDSFVVTNISYNKNKITWKAIPGVSGYELYYSKNNKTFKRLKKTKALSYTHKKLKTGKTYYYRVRTYTKVNGKKVYGPFGPIESAKPYLRTNVATVTKIDDINKITWTTISGKTKYQLYYSTDGITFTRLKTTKKKSFIHKSLDPEATYYYKVRAYRLVGSKKVYSEFSDVVIQTP